MGVAANGSSRAITPGIRRAIVPKSDSPAGAICIYVGPRFVLVQRPCYREIFRGLEFKSFVRVFPAGLVYVVWSSVSISLVWRHGGKFC